MKASPRISPTTSSVPMVAICGNPNSGKTTIFNAITGLNQKVANYPGVTVERVSGQFSAPDDHKSRFELLDIPGTYSLAAFSPDEHIAASALYGGIDCQRGPDVIICVVDAANLERGLYLVLQVAAVGCPMVVALNMIDVARRRRIRIHKERLSRELGGIPVIPVIGNRGQGIEQLKRVAVALARRPVAPDGSAFGPEVEDLIAELGRLSDGVNRTRAALLRVIFDVGGPAERKFIANLAEQSVARETIMTLLDQGRALIRNRYGSLAGAETMVLSRRAAAICAAAQVSRGQDRLTRSEQLDRILLHPLLGPVLLVLMMTLVFQSIFSWARPLMELVDRGFAALAHYAAAIVPPGPLQSLLTDGVIGGVGSVLIFLPQIIILFLFIAVLEDSGYMSRAAFLVDRLFRWCGLSGKSFIPMLSSFACAVPGIMATRTIEDRKLRFVTIMVAPLMTCSARLPVYAVMIAAFVPQRTCFGIFNLQGLTLTGLYLLGMVAAVTVSFVLQKTVFRTERGTFIMEMPSYKLPTMRSVLVRVTNRARSFVVRAGTVICAITVIIWALSYYPRSAEIENRFAAARAQLGQERQQAITTVERQRREVMSTLSADQADVAAGLDKALGAGSTPADAAAIAADARWAALPSNAVSALEAGALIRLDYEDRLRELSNQQLGERLRTSYFGRIGRALEPLFSPMGWDWRISMSVLASFPAREVIIATLGTIFNLGSDADVGSRSLVTQLRQAKWDSTARAGANLFSTSVALSIVVFFALCCQCGATIVTMRQETNSWRYPVFVFVYMSVLAYGAALATYQIASGLGL